MSTGNPSLTRRPPADFGANQLETTRYAIANLTKQDYWNGGRACTTRLTMNGMAFSILDTSGTTSWGSQQLLTFPAGVTYFSGASGYITPTVTSTLSSTLNASSTVQWGLGTAAASAATLATTMINILTGSGQTPASFTSSATINVASAQAAAFKSGATLDRVDGTATANKCYLNMALATTTDIDGDATLTIVGDILIHWEQHGKTTG